MMPELSWDEISDLKHEVSNDITVISGAIQSNEKSNRLLLRSKKRLKKFEDKLQGMILRHEKEVN